MEHNIAPQKSVMIIAEAGVNHNGDLKLAKELVDIADEAGADYVKFQTAKLEQLVTDSAPMAGYQKINIGKVESQKEMLRKLLLSYDSFEELNLYCQNKRIKFLSTPFDIDSILFLEHINIPFWKIPSGEVTNYPYLVKIGKTKKPVVISTGMATLNEINEAINVLRQNGTTEITILHCHTEYPTRMEDVNLRVMQSYRDKFGVNVGYSDHTLGIEVPIAAVACGASVIEKHFTISRSMKGPDHICSLEPKELAQMVKSIRNIELAMGSAEKHLSDKESKNRLIARKSIVCIRKITKGQVITEEFITTKRPGTGISPMEWNNLIGKRANRDYDYDELIEGCILDEQ